MQKNGSSIFDLRSSILGLEWSLVFQKVMAFPLALLFITSCSTDLSLDVPLKVATGQSPYLTRIFDYQYGPGQHASMIPSSENGAVLLGQPWVGGKSFLPLGGWGGYVTAGFDHPVINANGPDVAIYTQPSVSSEPGIVYVMTDTNGDGMPNDGAWYELRGSEFNNPETIHNYQVTYFKPGSSGYVTWKDNNGKSGTLVPHFGTDSWWWSGYGDKTSITFSGEKLPDAYVNTSSDQSLEFWNIRTGLFQYGYAECYENLDFNSKLKANFLDLSTAVDASGLSVSLAKVNFIKIQSSVFQMSGWLNEVSTEISGAADLSLLDKKSY